MRSVLSCVVVAVVGLAGFGALSAAELAKPTPKPRIQIAILLDVSGSMTGLINQARTQLWRIVNELATAQRDGQIPTLEVALYEYGNGKLSARNGYMRRVLPLTTDLDRVSERLFALTVGGSEEYCGQVIQAATKGLAWSGSSEDLKAIFIAGNEAFTQGKVDYRKACKAAITKGITVNTIYCQRNERGIKEQWQAGAALADGRCMTIDQDQKVVQVAAPQDQEIVRLGTALNKTYIAYGRRGSESAANQIAQDANARRSSVSSFVQRQAAKSSAHYRNASWDLVDAVEEGKIEIDELKDEDLPETMRKMDVAARKAYVAAQAKERRTLQAKIKTLAAEREKFVAEALKKRGDPARSTLDEAVIAAVRAQAARQHFSLSSRK